jgi:hypothetical protein
MRNWLRWRWRDLTCWLARHDIQHLEYQRDNWERQAICWRERCEMYAIERDAWQKRYEYILDLKTTEAMLRPPAQLLFRVTGRKD